MSKNSILVYYYCYNHFYLYVYILIERVCQLWDLLLRLDIDEFKVQKIIGIDNVYEQRKQIHNKSNAYGICELTTFCFRNLLFQIIDEYYSDVVKFLTDHVTLKFYILRAMKNVPIVCAKMIFFL